MVYVLALTAFLSWSATPASGVVLHPDGEPNLATWTDRPADDVLGRWGYVASCVAVSSNCVITTQHQTASVPWIAIGGKQYTIAQIWNHDTADLRVAKLAGANLADFVDIYELTDERFKQTVIGGYGDGRGELLQKDGLTYGYQWDGSNNATRRFGTNKINRTLNNSTIGDLTSDIVIADFDGLGEVAVEVIEQHLPGGLAVHCFRLSPPPKNAAVCFSRAL